MGDDGSTDPFEDIFYSTKSSSSTNAITVIIKTQDAYHVIKNALYKLYDFRQNKNGKILQNHGYRIIKK